MPALKLVPNAVQYSKVIENIICGAGMAPLFDIYQDMLKKRPKMSCNLGRIIFGVTYNWCTYAKNTHIFGNIVNNIVPCCSCHQFWYKACLSRSKID